MILRVAHVFTALSCFFVLNVAEAKKDDEPSEPELPPCDLCVGGSMGLRWPGAHIDKHGTTCVDHLIELFSYDPQSTECRWEIIKHRNRCCGENPPPDLEQVPTESPQDYQGSGGDGLCELCWNGNYPEDTSMVIAMLDIGDGAAASCADFWMIGQDGLIPEHLCETIQYFAFEPCGCGDPNDAPPKPASQSSSSQTTETTDTAPPVTTKPTSSPTKSPTKGPTREPSTSPTKNPTPFPTSAPSRGPTSRPTEAPITLSPSESPSLKPTPMQTLSPTKEPTGIPSAKPSEPPTSNPTKAPIPIATKPPSPMPSTSPTTSPQQDTSGEVPVIRQQRSSYNDGKDGITKLSDRTYGGAGGAGRQRRLKGI